MGRDVPDGLEKIQEALDRGGDRRPPLYNWMLRHYGELSARFAGRRLDWRILSEAFAEIGFCGPDGAPLKPKSVQQAWYRVGKQRHAFLHRQASRKAAEAAVQEIVPRVVSSPGGVRPTLSGSAGSAGSAVGGVCSAVPDSPMPSALADIYSEINKRSGRG